MAPKNTGPGQRGITAPSGPLPKNAEQGPPQPKVPHGIGNSRPDTGVDTSRSGTVRPPRKGGSPG